MTRFFATISALALVAGFGGNASATMSNISTTPPVTNDDSNLTFLALFNDSNSSPNTLAPDIEGYLAGLGVTGITYLGRSDGTGGNGTSVSVTGSGTASGFWTLNPGSTHDVADYLVMHAGEGRTYALFQINTPDDGGDSTANWDTTELGGHGLSFLDLYGAPAQLTVTGGDSPTPEPASLSLFGAALAGLATTRRRKAR